MAESHSFYGWVIFHYMCVCVPHMFFIHSSVDGHRLVLYLDYCKLCSYEHQGACSFLNHFFFFFRYNVFVFSGIYPGVELLTHMVILALVFQGITILFSTVTAPIYIPTNSVLGFHFFHFLTNILICRHFNSSLLM